MVETLVQLQNLIMQDLQHLIKYAEKEQLTNTQEFINFLDSLNELSVTY